mgnify:FL=1
MKTIFEKLLDLIYPPKCMFCGKIEKNHICKDCIKIVKNEEKITVLDYNAYLFEYKDKLRDKIIEYKFDDKPYLYKDFAYLFINNQKICDFLKSYDIITAVPMYYKKKMQRGYNQTELIAKELSKKINNLEYVNLLNKIKNTNNQMNLNKEERMQNLIGAYKINEKSKHLIANKNVLIFDDIYTTGSTIKECKKEIYKYNPKIIGTLTIAKDFI